MTERVLLLGLLFWILHRHPKLPWEWPGFFAALFLIIYGIMRLLTDFYRIDQTYIGPLSTGQWASLMTAIIGIILLAYLRQVRPTSLLITDEIIN